MKKFASKRGPVLATKKKGDKGGCRKGKGCGGYGGGNGGGNPPV